MSEQESDFYVTHGADLFCVHQAIGKRRRRDKL
jgi:hypothetical protein